MPTQLPRKPYPLQWPEGWKRATNRLRPAFGSGQFTKVRDSVIRSLRKRGSFVVITSNLPTNSKGLPINIATDDPGVAVWWVQQGRDHVIACDRWRSAALNLRAIDMTLTAMRGIDRWGTGEMAERTYAGFAALPPGAPAASTGKRPWREVLGEGRSWPEELANDELLAVVKSRYRHAMSTHHPDHGGAVAFAAELTVAMEEAEQELSQ